MKRTEGYLLPRGVAALVAGAMVLAVMGVSVARAATPTDLFISEYIDGASNNKAIEIFNGTGAPIDLESGTYLVQIFANGSVSPTSTITLTGVVPSGEVFVVSHSSAEPEVWAVSDQQSTGLNFNGNDAVALRIGASGAVIDLIGQIGVDPGAAGWGSGEQITNDRTLVRKSTIDRGRAVNDPFDPALEWNVFSFNTTLHLGSHTFDGGPASTPQPTASASPGATSAPDTGVVDAAITMADSSLCLELSTASIDFGQRQFGDEGVRGSPDIDVTNCSETTTTLLARGTDAAATDASWALVKSGASCADTLGTDAYHLALREGVQGSTAVWQLGTANTELLDLPAGGVAPFWPTLDAACPGSSGAGQRMSMQIIFVATEASTP